MQSRMGLGTDQLALPAWLADTASALPAAPYANLRLADLQPPTTGLPGRVERARLAPWANKMHLPGAAA